MIKKLVKEIREQPLHIRKLFMWTSVVITFSLVGFVWLNDTKKDVVALLNGGSNPAQEIEQKQPSSPFAAIGKAFGSLRANMGELFGGKSTPTPEPTKTILPQRLP